MNVKRVALYGGFVVALIVLWLIWDATVKQRQLNEDVERLRQETQELTGGD